MSNFKNKKVVVMGLGLHGGGVAIARWLVQKNAKVLVTDLKKRLDLKPSLEKLKGLPIKFHLAGHRATDFKNADIVIQNPAVPRESKFLKIAKKSGVQIENEATLFFKLHNPKKIIGITGTRGKSTVSSLIYEILKQKTKKVFLAGNIKTTAMFDIIDKVKKDDWVVLELSSWHLENLGESKLSPQLAIVTNIMPDHLNRYCSLKDYIKAKENIFKNQNQNDFVVLNKDDKYTQQMGKKVVSQRFWFSQKYFSQENGSFIKGGQIIFRQNGKERKICQVSDIQLLGQHNISNVLAGVTAASILGVKPNAIRKAVKNFKGIADRLELIKNVNGVKYYNDTTSTIPEATIAAIKTLAKKKNIILIAGGTDKKLAFKNLTKEIKRHCQAVVLFEGQGSDKIEKELRTVSYKSINTKISNMSDAVGIAKSYSQKGDIILLSPACASFNLFINEFDRGNQFKEIVSKL